MIGGRYDIEIDDDYKTYEFVSTGPKGKFRKIVQYKEISSNRLLQPGFW
jgi:hypothetical protein